MKKSTKSTKPVAPQAKSVTPKAVEPKPAKKTAAPRKKSTDTTPAPVPPPVVETPNAPVSVTPIEATAPTSATETTITAQIDVGFGNALYIRGEGPGLSWEKGRPLDCVSGDKWSISVAEVNRPVVFKFLLNDETWSAGSDYVIEPGSAVVLAPTF